MNWSKNKIIGVVLVVVLVLVVLKVAVLSRNMGNYVVYLSTGEVYVGELSMFPKMKLQNGYILTTAQDPADPKKSNFQLNPLNEALWAPKHLYLNRKNVVFYGPLSPESSIAKKLAEQAKN